jgi:uncharacterized repeat protein (TIGR01451 family)
VAKINPSAESGQQLQWSTYLGGTQSDYSTGVGLDPGAANVYVVGTTNSQDFVAPTTLTTFGSFQQCLNNLTASCTTQTNPAPYDAFVARLTNPTSSSTQTNMVLNYFSYLGGADNEAGLAIAVDNNSGALITGWTQSPLVLSTATPPEPTSGSFPVAPYPNSIQSNLYCTQTAPITCAQDAFMARINTAAAIGQGSVASWANYFGGSTIGPGGPPATGWGTGVALDVNQNTYFAGYTNTTGTATGLQTDEPIQSQSGGGYDAYVTQFQSAVQVSITGVLTLGTNQTYISAGNPATFTYTLTNTGSDPANDLVITDNLSSQATGIPVTFVSATVSSGLCTSGSSSNTSISCGPISLQAGSTATLTVTITPSPSTNCNPDCISPETFNGGTVQVLGQGNIVLAETSVPASMSDYNVAVSPRNQNVAQAGDTAPYQVQVTPSPLFNSNITLSCSNLPAATTCNFNPSSTVSLQSTSGATATLNVVTTARPITTTALVLPRRFYAIWLAVPGLALLGVGSGSRRRRKMAGLLMLCWILSLVVVLPACTHSTAQAPVSGTPAGNYNILVTAASGTDSKTQTIGLSVP